MTSIYLNLNNFKVFLKENTQKNYEFCIYSCNFFLMEISVNDSSDPCSISISGEIDLDKSAEVRLAIMNNLNAGKNVNLNLSNVNYIDSSGISCLIEGTQQAAKNNLSFIIDKPSDEVLKVIELAFLDKILKIRK